MRYLHTEGGCRALNTGCDRLASVIDDLRMIVGGFAVKCEYVACREGNYRARQGSRDEIKSIFEIPPIIIAARKSLCGTHVNVSIASAALYIRMCGVTAQHKPFKRHREMTLIISKGARVQVFSSSLKQCVRFGGSGGILFEGLKGPVQLRGRCKVDRVRPHPGQQNPLPFLFPNTFLSN